MRGKRLALAAGAVSLLLASLGPGVAAAKKPPVPDADVWIETLDVTCPEVGVVEVALVAGAAADTIIIFGQAVLTEMRAVSMEDGYYPYPTSIRVAEWWEARQNPETTPLIIGFRTDDGDFDSTTWEGDKHHFWNPTLTGEDPGNDAWFRASAMIEGRTSARGPTRSWDIDDLQVYHNCQTGQTFTPTANPWEGWNHPEE